MTIADHAQPATPRPIGEILEFNAEIETWFGVGGRADMLARPHCIHELTDLLHAFAQERVRILGDGANLLVHEDGVNGLVICLDAFTAIETIDETDTRVVQRVGAGVRLPRLIVDSVRNGLAGLEGLAGVPASIGGAVRMNAGGAFGTIGDCITAVHAITRSGQRLTIPASEIGFDYRHSGLEHLIIVAADIEFERVGDDARPALRERLKHVMAKKKASQPLGDDSAGCVFKNPTVRGERLSAGMLIDTAQCKGMRIGGAVVSDVHANFVVTEEGCKPSDIVRLIGRVSEIVLMTHGVRLEPEVVFWCRDTIA
ncbi:MAG: UDP-N-acetylmuramate dehydrogenase [Planctomycetota bacterium]